MPELPEVDLMVSRLQKQVGKRINEIQISRGKYLRETPRGPIPLVSGQWINEIHRRGKFIIFHLTHGTLVCHNAMSGFWDTEDEPWTFDYVEGKRQATPRDVRVQMHLGTHYTWSGVENRTNLRFHDARLFGSLRYYDTLDISKIPSLKDLGPEAITTEHSYLGAMKWNILDLVTVVVSNERPIKDILMNQKNVAGIGNIYATEALFRAGINPSRVMGMKRVTARTTGLSSG